MEHILSVAENMRPADQDEIWAACHLSPLESLTRAFMASPDAYAGMADDQPLLIYGLSKASFLQDVGHPWMLGAVALEKHSKALLRASKNIPMEMLTKYKYLLNYVDARNEKAIRWLKWLGFSLRDPIPFGVEKLPFHPFVMSRG